MDVFGLLNMVMSATWAVHVDRLMAVIRAVTVFVIVPVIAIWTMHVAFFAMIVPVMVVIVGIAQGRVHQLLDCDRSCALVRFFKTHPYSALTEDDRRYVRNVLGGEPAGATDEPRFGWQTRHLLKRSPLLAAFAPPYPGPPNFATA